MNTEHEEKIQVFISRWELSGAAERANAQSFINELCEIIEVERPAPKRPIEDENAYVFEKTIPSERESSNFIDCYKRGYFVLETKQGISANKQDAFSARQEERLKKKKIGHGKRGTRGWDAAMQKAKWFTSN
jgi:hypothetical protein